jgi:excisionase family DNA binding protein
LRRSDPFSLNLPTNRPISFPIGFPIDFERSRTVRRDGVAMSNDQADAERLLTPAEVAAMFRVNAKTVTRWARSGRLSAIKTMGGHRRYRLSEVRRAVEAIGTDA